MKKILTLLFALMAFIFCAKAQTFLSEGFESGNLPAGWTIIDSDGDGSNWYPISNYPDYAHTGSGLITSASYASVPLTPDNWLITPAINLTADATLSFWVAGQDPSWAAENYSVYVATGNTVADFTATTPLITTVSSGVWEQKTFDLSDYTGQTVYIAFRHYNVTDMFRLNLDDITVFAMPTSPTIDVAPLTVDFGNVILGDTSVRTVNVTGYLLSSDITATTTSPFALSTDGLTFNTTTTIPQTGGTLYIQYIPSMSGEETGSINLSSTGAASVTVTLNGSGLDCSNTTLPLAQSFEDASTLQCWSAVSMSTENGMGINNEYASAGSQCFLFRSDATATSGDYNQYLITPELPNTVNKMITFDYFPYSYYLESFKVGYSTTTNDIDDFTWGPVVSAYGTTSEIWTTYVNDSIPADAKYIAINYCPGSQQYYILIDNIVISEVTDCMPPISVNISNVTQNTASIDWTPFGDETAWSVAVVEQGGDPDLATAEYVTAHPYTVTDLMPSTTYEVYVRAECATGSGNWSASAVFTTTPDCSNPSNPQVTSITGTSAVISWTAAPYGVTSYTVEYGEAGSGSTDQVFVDSATTVTLTGLNPQTDYEFTITSDCNSATITPTPVAGTFTTGCLVGGEVVIGNGTESTYYYPSNSCYNYSTSEQIYTAAEIGGANTLHSVSFDCNATASSPTRNLTIYLMHTTQISANGWLTMTGAEQVYSGNYTFTTGWNTINFDTTFAYNGTDNLAIIIDDNTGSYSCSNYFNGHINSNGSSAYYYSDGTNVNPMSPSNTPNTNSVRANIKFGGECDETSTCVTPVVTNLAYTSNEATITWSPGYQESAWNLQYKTVNDTAWTDEGSVSSPYTISNLLPDADYEIRLYSDCGSEMSTPAVMNFRTECAALIPPFTETFTGWDNNPSDCWNLYSGLASSVFAGGALTSTTSGWYFTNTNVFPVGHPKVNVYGYSCNYWLVTPAIDLTNMVDPELSFELALTDYNNEDPIESTTAQQDDKFMVIVSTDNGQTWSQSNATVWSDQGSARAYSSISNQGEDVSVSLAQYAGQTIMIAFYVESTVEGGDNDLHITNVHVGERPTCPKPQVVNLTNATSSSIEFSWVPAGDESAWEYTVAPQGTTLDFDTVQWISAYDTFAVISNLNANTVYTIYVRSNCDNGDQSEPKTLDARTACGEITIPFCEGFENYATGSTAPIYCWTRSNDYSSSSNYPYVNTYAANGTKGLYFYGSTGNYNLIATPQIDNTVSLNTLLVSFNMKVSSASSAMVVGVMTDPTDLSTFVGIDTVTNSTAGAWVFEEVSLSSYTGNGSYVALKYMPGTSYTTVYVDDITIEEIPSCPKPTNLSAQSTASDTVLLSWTDDAGDLWDVIYGPTGFDPLTSTDASTVYGLTTTSCAIDGLTAGVIYDFYVRRDCGNGDVSPWSSFPVQGSPYMVAMGITGSSSVTGCGFTVVDDGGISGNYSNDCDYTLTIYPSDPDSLITISGTFSGEGTADYLSVYQGTTVDEANLLQKITANSGTVNVGPFTSEVGPITLKFHSDYSVVYAGFVINVNCVSVGSCRKPAYFTAVGSTNTSATVTWTEMGTATSWNVAYGAPGFDPDNAVNIEYASDTVLVVNNLTAGTTYDFYVQSDCGGETSEWAGPITITPGTYNMPVTGNATITMCGGTIYDNGGANGNYANNCDARLTVNPETSADLVSISGTLTAESATWDYLIIYDGDGTTELYHSSQSGSSPVTFGPYVSTTGPLTIYFHSDGSTNFEGFVLNVTCTPAPTCRKPLNFQVVGTTTTDAILSWTEIGTATTWNIEYGPTGFTPGQGMTEIATTNPYTVTGLTITTAYDFYVQADCGGGDVSEWSSVATATTDCDVIATFPYTENFDASTNLPDCWNNANVTGDTEWEVSTPDEGSVNSAHSGSNAAVFYQDDEGDQADLQMPTFDLTSLTNPVLTFWYTNESWAGDIDELTVYYRNSVTDAWSQLTSHTSGASTWTFDSLALPNPSATYQIKFHATSNYGYGIHIDDVIIMDANGSTPPVTTCDVPTNLAVSNITTTGATATWTAGGTETAWNLQYKAASAADWSSAIPVTAATYTFAGLAPNTQYQVRVQAACDATTTSDWTAAVSFTTAQESGDPCVDPSNLASTGTEAHTITITWTENGTATSWTVYYRVNGATSWITETANATNYTITGLEPETEYTIQVVANCADGATSEPSNTINVTTQPDGIEDYDAAAVNVFPNPTTGMVQVSSSKFQVSGVDVYDVYGKLLKTDAMMDNSTVDMSGYAAGVYFLRISTENGVVTKRVVKR